MKLLSIALGAAVLTTSGAAAAQGASDARCIVLAMGWANRATDANHKKIADDALYFYLGRIGPQTNSAEFKAALDEQAKTITDANAGTLMGECVAAVNTKMQLLRSLATPRSKPPANPQGR